MTKEELRQKPLGTILDIRSLHIEGHEETYVLGKGKEGKYFIGFSPSGGGSNSRYVIEEDMVKLMNSKDISDIHALDIYYLDSHLYYQTS